MIVEVAPSISVTLDGSGNGQVSLSPPGGTKWALRLSSVSVSPATKIPQVTWYRGSASGPIELIDSSYQGNSDSTGKVGGTFFFTGQALWAVWTGGDPGATATLQAWGRQGAPNDPFDPEPVGAGANDPVVGGTTLIRPAIQSPNYEAGLQGWTINADGSAEFNDVVIRAGQVISGTALFYRSTPALGNLAFAISAVAGVDEFGNAYPAGISMFGTTGQQVNIQANAVNPQLTFKSLDHTNQAFVNGPTSGSSLVDLGANSGQSTPGDGIARTYRLFLQSANNSGRLECIRASNQTLLGGQVRVTPTSAVVSTSDGTHTGSATLETDDYLVSVTDGSNTAGLEVLVDNAESPPAKARIDITATDVRVNGRSTPQGFRGSANFTGTASLTTTAAIMFTIPAFDWAAGRAFRVRFNANLLTPSAVTAARFTLRASTLITGTPLAGDFAFQIANTGATGATTCSGEAILINDTASPVHAAINLSGRVLAGTAGLANLGALFAYMYVEDIGASFDYFWAPQIVAS